MSDTKMSAIAELNIARDFSAYPGTRKRANSEHPETSGEEFLEKYFIPWLEKNKDAEKLVVNLDGAASYPPAFLEEAFGGAVWAGYGDQVAKVEIISNDEPELKEEIKWDIASALAGKEISEESRRLAQEHGWTEEQRIDYLKFNETPEQRKLSAELLKADGKVFVELCEKLFANDIDFFKFLTLVITTTDKHFNVEFLHEALHLTMAEAYELLGDKENAIKYYKIAGVNAYNEYLHCSSELHKFGERIR